ncbi:hypothetical protein BDY21DRAFT_32588 [Lineolata rhizophorae]|uniref:HIG1 domain-containing protein n=1 Tax=Lineolata rhizophorae TaxID=578093 RepID=A0A6A6P0P2_9PEZI|nr:hypothetical protein BDY21DRAFT_32588 [Lineolata rhizophorae]
MRAHGRLKTDEQANAAAWEAARGAGYGAAKWGIFATAVAATGYAVSPLYRGLTFQFKVFLQMSLMTLGASIHADRALRAHERRVRHNAALARDAAVWRSVEDEFESRGTPGVQSESGVRRVE